MKALSYYLTIFIAYPISLLPFPLLYIVSDFFYFLLYHVFQYRKQILYNNLKKSFPDKSDQKIKKLIIAFYKNFGDVIVECIKMLTISKKALLKRCTFKNIDFLNDLYKDNTSVIAVVGHYCNWELGGLSLVLNTKHHVVAIFKDLSNKYFMKLINTNRAKFSTELVVMEQAQRALIKNKDRCTLNIFIADQAPLQVDNCYWMTFLNQDTPVFLGTEKIAKKTNFPVVFLYMQREKRGYYNVEILEVCMDPAKSKENEITEKHTKILEDIIIKKPENWLWTHKRWQRKRPDYLKAS